MTTQNKQLAFNTLDNFASARVDLIKGMRDAGYTTVEECRPIVIEWACAKAKAGKAGFTVSDAGKVMMNSKHPKYNTIKTIVRDITLMLQGTTRKETTRANESNRTEPVNPFAKAVKQFETKQQALKAFEEAWANRK
jgi:hypothetical protein